MDSYILQPAPGWHRDCWTIKSVAETEEWRGACSGQPCLVAVGPGSVPTLQRKLWRNNTLSIASQDATLPMEI